MPPCPAEWISEKSWGELVRLNDLSGYKGFLEHFNQKHASYKPMYDSPSPQDYVIKEEYYQKLTSFQKMIILRCIRPDKVIPAISKYVVE